MKHTITANLETNKRIYVIFLSHWAMQYVISFLFAPLALFFTGLTMGIVACYVRKASALALILGCVSICLAVFTLHSEIRKSAQWGKCFEFNVSYPGTDTFDTCEREITMKDYHYAFRTPYFYILSTHD